MSPTPDCFAKSGASKGPQDGGGSFFIRGILQKRSFVNRILLFISLQKRLDNCVPSGLVQKHVQTI